MKRLSVHPCCILYHIFMFLQPSSALFPPSLLPPANNVIGRTLIQRLVLVKCKTSHCFSLYVKHFVLKFCKVNTKNACMETPGAICPLSPATKTQQSYHRLTASHENSENIRARAHMHTSTLRTPRLDPFSHVLILLVSN